MIGKKLMTGPALTLHTGWQLVPLSSTRNYGAKQLWLVCTTAADVTLSTDITNSWTLKSGYTLEVDLDGAPLVYTKSAEMLSNGNCTATGSWLAGTGWRFGKTGNTGKARCATGGAGAVLRQNVTPEADTVYELSFKYTYQVTGSKDFTPSFGGTSWTEVPGTGATGREVTRTECQLTSNATGPLRFANDTNARFNLDDISLKKVTGNQLLFAKGTAGLVLQILFTI